MITLQTSLRIHWKQTICKPRTVHLNPRFQKNSFGERLSDGGTKEAYNYKQSEPARTTSKLTNTKEWTQPLRWKARIMYLFSSDLFRESFVDENPRRLSTMTTGIVLRSNSTPPHDSSPPRRQRQMRPPRRQRQTRPPRRQIQTRYKESRDTNEDLIWARQDESTEAGEEGSARGGWCARKEDLIWAREDEITEAREEGSARGGWRAYSTTKTNDEVALRTQPSQEPCRDLGQEGKTVLYRECS